MLAKFNFIYYGFKFIYILVYLVSGVNIKWCFLSCEKMLDIQYGH